MRVYPACCTSANCGATSCPETCPMLPVLTEFKAWRDRTGAVVSEPVWCPTVYTIPAEKGGDHEPIA